MRAKYIIRDGSGMYGQTEFNTRDDAERFIARQASAPAGWYTIVEMKVAEGAQ